MTTTDVVILFSSITTGAWTAVMILAGIQLKRLVAQLERLRLVEVKA